MVKIDQNRVQSLVSKIDSCTNPRNGRSYLNTLRNVLKSGDNDNLDYETLDSIVRVEAQRGDSINRVINLHNNKIEYSSSINTLSKIQNITSDDFHFMTDSVRYFLNYK